MEPISEEEWTSIEEAFMWTHNCQLCQEDE